MLYSTLNKVIINLPSSWAASIGHRDRQQEDCRVQQLEFHYHFDIEYGLLDPSQGQGIRYDQSVFRAVCRVYLGLYN